MEGVKSAQEHAKIRRRNRDKLFVIFCADSLQSYHESEALWYFLLFLRFDLKNHYRFTTLRGPSQRISSNTCQPRLESAPLRPDAVILDSSAAASFIFLRIRAKFDVPGSIQSVRRWRHFAKRDHPKTLATTFGAIENRRNRESFEDRVTS